MSDTTTIFDQKPDFDTTGGRLSRAREASGLSAKQLAWRLGVKTSTIDAWERDRSQPGSHRLSNLAGILNVSLCWILHGVGTPPADAEDGPHPNTINLQVDRLKSLHAEIGQLLGRLQHDMYHYDTAR